MLPIQKMLIKYNFSNRNGAKVEYIVIHDTGNTGSKADVDAHFNYFNGANRNASADYFVDDKKIGQFVEDYNYSWAVGDGKGAYGITNRNSVSIELCINPETNRATAINNLVDLTKYLMNKYGLSSDKVKRHYDASRKTCPFSMSSNNWAEWYEFKKRLEGNNTSSGSSNSTSELYRVRKSWGDVSSQKGAYSNLTNAINEAKKHSGYKVYNASGIQVYPEVVTVSSITTLVKSYKETGRATVTGATKINVRNSYKIENGDVSATYSTGESFNYDMVYITKYKGVQYVWCSYISYSGVRRYVCAREGNTRYLTCV